VGKNPRAARWKIENLKNRRQNVGGRIGRRVAAERCGAFVGAAGRRGESCFINFPKLLLLLGVNAARCAGAHPGDQANRGRRASKDRGCVPGVGDDFPDFFRVFRRQDATPRPVVRQTADSASRTPHWQFRGMARSWPVRRTAGGFPVRPVRRNDEQAPLPRHSQNHRRARMIFQKFTGWSALIHEASTCSQNSV